MTRKADQQVLDEGRRARTLLNDEDVSAILAEIEAGAFEQFKGCAINDTAEMMRLHTVVVGVQELRAALRTRIDRALVVEGKK